MSSTELQGPTRVVTLRALLAGVVCCVIIATGVPYGTLKLKASTLALDFSVPAAVFMMFVLALVISLFRFATRGRTFLNPGEMLVVFSMMAVTCAICTMGLTAYLVPMLGAPKYYGSLENQWNVILVPDTPQWLMLSPSGAGKMAIDYLFEGLPSGLSHEQKIGIIMAWLKPLGYWSILLLAFYGTSICLMSIFRKQWVENERIVYPLVQLPMELAEPPGEPGGRVTPILKNRLLWLGFAIPFIYCCLHALPSYFPYLIDLKPRDAWSIRLLQEQWELRMRLSWQTIGLTYLVSSDVGLCVWLFGLLGSFYHGLSTMVGFKSAEKLGIYGAGPYPDLAHFGMGAIIALALLRLWIGRRHLLAVTKRALCIDKSVDDSQEPMSYFNAFWGTILGLVIMTIWLVASGFSLPIALLILFGAFVGLIGLTRIIAESGMPVSIVPLISSDFVVSAVGTSAIGKQGLLALPWTYVWNGDVRTCVMVSAANGIRASSGKGRKYRGLFLALMLAALVAMIASILITLVFAYQDGGINLSPGFFGGGTKVPFRRAAELIRGKPLPPNLRGWVVTGIGAVVMVLFTIARHSFVGWPINPVGLPIATVRWTQHLWFSVLLAWILKTRILKYGGPKLYMKLRPIFLGLLLGQYTGAAVWIIIDAITGTVGNRVFWM